MQRWHQVWWYISHKLSSTLEIERVSLLCMELDLSSPPPRIELGAVIGMELGVLLGTESLGYCRASNLLHWACYRAGHQAAWWLHHLPWSLDMELGAVLGIDLVIHSSSIWVQEPWHWAARHHWAWWITGHQTWCISLNQAWRFTQHCWAWRIARKWTWSIAWHLELGIKLVAAELGTELDTGLGIKHDGCITWHVVLTWSLVLRSASSWWFTHHLSWCSPGTEPLLIKLVAALRIDLLLLLCIELGGLLDIKLGATLWIELDDSFSIELALGKLGAALVSSMVHQSATRKQS
jgi:hypothetical protein